METRLRPSKNEYFLSMLKLVASRSTCARRSVGAIITNIDGQVLSTGYNGVVKNAEHCINVPCKGVGDKPGDTSNCAAVHAEVNAVLQCLDLSRAHTIYCSCVPCYSCSKMLANTNIEVVICESDYADKRGLEILKDQGCYIEIAGKEWTNEETAS